MASRMSRRWCVQAARPSSAAWSESVTVNSASSKCQAWCHLLAACSGGHAGCRVVQRREGWGWVREGVRHAACPPSLYSLPTHPSRKTLIVHAPIGSTDIAADMSASTHRARRRRPLLLRHHRAGREACRERAGGARRAAASRGSRRRSPLQQGREEGEQLGSLHTGGSEDPQAIAAPGEGEI